VLSPVAQGSPRPSPWTAPPTQTHLDPTGSWMGTHIIAVTFPTQVVGRRGFALVVWLGAAVLLVALLAATTAHWAATPSRPGPTSPTP